MNNSKSLKSPPWRLTIGTIATFDEISDITDEFYKEWKEKKKVESFILKNLQKKLNKEYEERKENIDFSFQEQLSIANQNFLEGDKNILSTTSDTWLHAKEEEKGKSFKKRPKRRKGGMKNLQDIL